MRLLVTVLSSFMLVGIARADDDCELESFGNACGAKMVGVVKGLGEDTNPTAHVAITNAPAKSHACIVIGAKKFKFRLPLSHCYSLVSGLIFLPAETDAHGRFAGKFTLPKKFKGPLLIQSILVDAKKMRLVATNGLALDCDD